MTSYTTGLATWDGPSIDGPPHVPTFEAPRQPSPVPPDMRFRLAMEEAHHWRPEFGPKCRCGVSAAHCQVLLTHWGVYGRGRPPWADQK